ncbi:MAG: hypothetical protein JO287_20245 [Pseudonocardiales bacterium]|nr:hypothetical protein [Pseudonocardiales bacterium]
MGDLWDSRHCTSFARSRGARMRSHPATKAYVARRRAEGKSKREIRRCLKRYIARQLYRALTTTMTPTSAAPST